ncbi:MAG TPA: hypothetical protein DIC30_11560 [Oceanospirillales bacterium]|jgi:hypothetical protein|nr:hypothetical protein [Oleispira sp.]HCM06632.1 hypothetical protein [Oceanospirillales bacterium]|tara:strand:+ start:471 stop:869 length:399 start_codon:yes stop_codon:yes gene_type:complete
MVDTWQPNSSNNDISEQKLADFSALIKSQEEAVQCLKELGDEDIKLIEALVNTPKSLWIKAVANLTNEQIINLCIFFTVGEMEFSNWVFGSKNPTIYFIKHLKSKNSAPEKDFIRWLKKQTDNRYIPYGAAL